jgi:hypothetical protein
MDCSMNVKLDGEYYEQGNTNTHETQTNVRDLNVIET